MKRLRFEWDPPKAVANLRKHGVSFEEARTVFFDEDALLLTFNEADLDPARPVHPKRLLKAMAS